jgi:hypothetical protein
MNLKKKSFRIFATCWNLLQKSHDLKFFSKFGKLGPFFQKNPLKV